jgi:SsrA-binding protein
MTTYAKNQKAFFDFEIIETISSGLELTGSEVKSIKEGKISLQGSYILARGGEAFLVGANIQPYQPSNTAGNVGSEYDPVRARRLILSKQELEHMGKIEATKGLTIVPISVYNKGRFLKVGIAIARGKKKFDKREALKKRDTERDAERKF